MRKLKVGIIGCGKISEAHLNGYESCDEKVKVEALADLDLSRAEEKAKLWDAKTFKDYKEMIRSTDLDAVDICLPLISGRSGIGIILTAVHYSLSVSIW